MTQQAPKVIDLTQTFVPVDPNSFPENLVGTDREDHPYKAAPVVAFEGYNFMPTSYGYRSYFGINSALNISALTSRVDDLFIVQTDSYENILVALCEDGIWTKRGESVGAWTQEVVLLAPEPGMHNNWSTAVIGDTVYMYRTGEAHYWYTNPRSGISSTLGTAPTAGALSIIDNISLYTDGGLVAGSYTYKVAYIASTGQLTAPSPATAAQVLASAGEIQISWTRLTAATGGYRLYRTLGTRTHYIDIAQTAVGVNPGFQDIGGSAWTVVVMPDSMEWNSGVAYAIAEATPSFLNMAGQVGIFKAAGRLGFWDSEDSVAWSSIDDLTDFTPAIETLAGSAIWKDVNGRITTILQHGNGFIIYAKKSIVYVQLDIGATFQWKPTVLLNKTGIAYPQEVVSGIPDSLHFAYTNTGLYKIEQAKADLIVPEVTDFLNETNDPVFLRLLEGRYLALQIIDPLYINGLVQFAIDTVPRTDFIYDGTTIPGLIVPGATLTGTEVCITVSTITAGATDEIQDAAEEAHGAVSGVEFPEKAPNTIYEPVYTAYFSGGNGLLDPANIIWGPTPCATIGAVTSTEYNFSPLGNAGKVSQASTGTTNKTVVTGAEAYVDGHWTIERFIAVQMAIWQTEENNRRAFLKAIEAKGAFEQGSPIAGAKISHIDYTDFQFDGGASKLAAAQGIVNGMAIAPVINECDIGTYVSKTSGPTFGYTACSFWITRYFTEAVKFVRTATTRQSFSVTQEPYWSDAPYSALTPHLQSPQAICDIRAAAIATPTLTYEADDAYLGQCMHPDGFTRSSVSKYIELASTQTTTWSAYNKAVGVPIATTPDTGFLVLTGWKYTGVDAVVRTVPAASCAAPNPPPATDGPPGVGNVPSEGSVNGVPAGIPIDTTNGTYCSRPFESITISAISVDPIVWPDTSVTIPASSFLLQEGTIGPVYPTFEGALVYDLALRKWGKMRLSYKQLLDYSPINNLSGAIIDADVFGVRAGVILSNGSIYLFDQFPIDSYIKYGKFGYYRQGMTTVEEAIVRFRSNSTGYLSIETSLDGKSPEASLGAIGAFTDALYHTMGAGDSCSGRWHTIKISGNYDLTHLEFRGTTNGRR